MLFRISILSLLVLVASVGCQKNNRVNIDASRYTNPLPEAGQNTALARKLHAKALEHMKSGLLDRAEAKLKEALTADPFFGPAHNNLGTLYFKQKKYYQAAWEFQYASRLMPGKVEPRNNLGMVFEASMKLNDAAEWYEKALALEPDNYEIAANLARTYIRAERKDPQTAQTLYDVFTKDPRPEWKSWAQENFSKLPKNLRDSAQHPIQKKIKTVSPPVSTEKP